jgi:hypothetical protein
MTGSRPELGIQRVERVTGSNPHYQLGKSVALFAFYLLTL